MPTIFTHTVVGIAAASTLRSEKNSAKLWLLAIVCAIAPDADIIAFQFGIPYEHFLGHRGLFHSLSFGLMLAMGAMLAFYRSVPLGSRRWWRLFAVMAVAAGSHGPLDALTDGGLGIALLSPFDATRYFFPWQPIPVSPLGVEGFLNYGGGKILWQEVELVWMPLLALILVLRVRDRVTGLRSES